MYYIFTPVVDMNYVHGNLVIRYELTTQSDSGHVKGNPGTYIKATSKYSSTSYYHCPGNPSEFIRIAPELLPPLIKAMLLLVDTSAT